MDITGEQIENYIIKKSGLDLKAFFDQYLRTIKIPVLEYQYDGKKLKYRFTNTATDFSIPVKVYIDTNPIWIKPTSNWNVLKQKGKAFSIDRNFYLESKSITD